MAMLLHLAGAVALLLYATRMVRTGVERAGGPLLRRRLQNVLSNPLSAALIGAVLAVAFQSATAVNLLLSSLAGGGLVTGITALMGALGADFGSAVVVRLLTLDLSLVMPVAIICGTVIFLSTEQRVWRQAGRILIGVSLMLLSLQLIGQASEPLRDSRLLPQVIGYLASDPATAFVVAAVCAWLFHSSVAFILLVVALATRGLIPADLGLVLMLGGNLGGALIAVVLTRGAVPETRAVPVANLLLRGGAALLAVTVLRLGPLPNGWLGATAAAQILNGHIAFNFAVVLLALPVAGRTHAVVLRLLSRSAVPPADLAPATALDDSVLGSPSLALANVTREVVKICGDLETMLDTVIGLYETPDDNLMDMVARLDDRIDLSHSEIKLYLARLAQSSVDVATSQRMQELLTACIALEQAGDVASTNLTAHARRKHDRGLSFSPEGWLELVDLHSLLLADARLAFNVIVSRDQETALALVRAKERFREAERRATAQHFGRLRDRGIRSIETSSLHLDTIRDLKQINSLLATLAYPVLEEQGLLASSRLRLPDTGTA
ncbi:Na/Pi cotransporter family protein [Tabrizicola sp.]|uniref:Na/Pi cotransporter family protein n=1 Tax=Tabrizicola sp. TaxID=2005166 RepID=UPI0035B1B0E9